MTVSPGWPAAPDLLWFGLGLLTLTLSTLALSRWAGLGLGRTPATALARAVVQLGIVATLLQGILSVPWTVVAFIALMMSTASLTSGSRLRSLWHGRKAAVAGVVSSSLVTLGLILVLALVDVDARQVVAVAGIIVGNSMTAATLAGRNFLRDGVARRDEVEGWLALGATPRRAYLDIGRVAARESLLPTLDQTRSTGLVTLPGAFVGALFGGASPVVAAQFQLVVLAGIALTMTLCALVVVAVIGRSPVVLTAR